MSFWDNVKKFAQPYSDEEYDDYEDDAEGFEEPEKEAAPRARRSSLFGGSSASEETSGYGATATAATATAAPASSGFSGQVLNMSTGKQEVVLFHAKAFEDAAKACDELRRKRAVVLNMENMDKSLTRRVVDFLSGSVYALDGSVKKVAQATYLFCPHSMDILGDLESARSETEG